MSAPRHVPVLVDRVGELLAPALSGPAPVAVDSTVGLGGHAAALLAAHPALTLVGVDRDPDALSASGRRLAEYGGRVRLAHARYDRVRSVLDEMGFDRVDAVLFDLGVSSPQVDRAERGFSYARDAPLDMRMDPTDRLTAADVVNGYSPGDLTRVLRDYGDERFASRIARAIARERDRAPFTSTARLADLVRGAVPAATRRVGGHPAKRTFQALRIEVNSELDALRAALPAAIDSLTTGGRIVVLSYHSGEDRIVKREFAARSVDTTPPDLPVRLPGAGPELRRLTRGAERPGEAELAANPRAASALLRAAGRLGGEER